jgi:hypothetical protein
VLYLVHEPTTDASWAPGGPQLPVLRKALQAIRGDSNSVFKWVAKEKQKRILSCTLEMSADCKVNPRVLIYVGRFIVKLLL